MLPESPHSNPKETATTLSGNHLFEIFTVPSEDVYSKSLQEMRKLGLSLIVGNSANLARTKFGEAVAEKVGAKFIHTGLKSKVDELGKDSVSLIQPEGLSSLKNVAKYLEKTALSKFHRFTTMSDEEKLFAGIDPNKMENTILIFGDAEDYADGIINGKPKNRAEAISQIGRAVSGDPYFIVNAQVAMWANIKKGLSTNIHITPVRVNPNLSKTNRWVLRNTWISLYDNPSVYITPRGASASNKEILPYIQVGVAKNIHAHSMEVSNAALLGEHELDWVDVLSLPQERRNEFCTNLMGAAPRGFADTLSKLVVVTQKIAESGHGTEAGINVVEKLGLVEMLSNLVI